MSKNFTHYGYMIGCDARINKKFRVRVNLRETKTMWITEKGSRFNKKTLSLVGEYWPLYKLQSEPVKKED